jgi:hypothetical protein
MNLMEMQIEENRRKLKTTVLYREGGTWDRIEVGRLVNGLKTEVSQHQKHPAYLVLFGHYTKEQTLQALLGGQAYTAIQVIGADSKELPFVPGFI